METIDENFIAYVKEAQQGRLNDGRYILCEKGKIIASGSQESMDALYKQMDSPCLKIIQVDLKFATSQNLADL